MKDKPFPAEAILSIIEKIRASMPKIDGVTPPPKPPDGDHALDDMMAEGVMSVEDFEQLTVLEALESAVTDLRAAIDASYAKATAGALEIYYKAEELARDPEHADLIPHVEAMRKAYEKEHGHPIPPKGKGK